jgi:hypothetical protein
MKVKTFSLLVLTGLALTADSAPNWFSGFFGRGGKGDYWATITDAAGASVRTHIFCCDGYGWDCSIITMSGCPQGMSISVGTDNTQSGTNDTFSF